MTRKKYISLFVVAAGSLTPAASAELVEFAFTGIVDYASPDSTPWGHVAAGQAYSVTYVFDTAAVDQSSDPQVGTYGGIIFMRMAIDDQTVTVSNALHEVLVRYCGSICFGDPITGYFVSAGGDGFSGFPVGMNADPDYFDSDALPATLNFDDYDSSRFVFFDSDSKPMLGGVLTGFSSRIVPAGSPAAFFAVAGLFAAAHRRRPSGQGRVQHPSDGRWSRFGGTKRFESVQVNPLCSAEG